MCEEWVWLGVTSIALSHGGSGQGVAMVTASLGARGP